MFLHNRYGVLILGALTGAALNFGRLMSEAFILSRYPPWVALVVALLVASLLCIASKLRLGASEIRENRHRRYLAFARTIAALAGHRVRRLSGTAVVLLIIVVPRCIAGLQLR